MFVEGPVFCRLFLFALLAISRMNRGRVGHMTYMGGPNTPAVERKVVLFFFVRVVAFSVNFLYLKTA